jgi:glycosyltransferase involved in cell wall biosynthesis
MSTQPVASVIIPARNASAIIGEQLDALARQRLEHAWEVIVVDDRSTDGTGEVARRYGGTLPSLRVIESDRSVNAGHARNVGAAAARGSLLLFTDADDVVGDGWLEHMISALGEASLVAGRLDVGRLNPPWLRDSLAVTQQHGLQVWDVGRTTWLKHAGGTNLGMSRDVWEHVGPFDVRLEFQEDIDLCFRAQLSGVELCFVSDAVVHNRLRSTLGGIFQQGRQWGRGSVLLQRKYLAHGMPRPSRVRGLLSWGRVPLELLMVRQRGDLARFLHRLGWRVGRLQGALDSHWHPY